VRAGLASMLISMVTTVAMPIQKEIGIPRIRRKTKLPTRMRM
jgi:hypothetical protein